MSTGVLTPTPKGVQICGPDVKGRVAVSQAGAISEWGPPLDESDPRLSGALATDPHPPHPPIAPIDLESILEWSRRAAEDRSEVPALLDELDRTELRALAARLVQLVGLLELCPADVDLIYFMGRVASLAGDFAEDPWTASEQDR